MRNNNSFCKSVANVWTLLNVCSELQLVRHSCAPPLHTCLQAGFFGHVGHMAERWLSSERCILGYGEESANPRCCFCDNLESAERMHHFATSSIQQMQH
jgi:hypothetical protein